MIVNDVRFGTPDEDVKDCKVEVTFNPLGILLD